MSRVFIVGDCHGFGGMVSAAHLAVELSADAIIACGDVWDVDMSIFIAGPDGKNAVPPFHVIPGNHERWNLWAKNSFRPPVVGHPHDYTTFELGGIKFGVIGRIDDLPIVHTLVEVGIDFGEMDKIFFQRLEGQQVRDALGGSDVLLFHDAPYPFVLGNRPKPVGDRTWIGAGEIGETEVTGSPYLNEVVRTVEPKFALHGHMHLLDIRYIGKTRVYGLPPIDPIFQHRGYALLDTQKMSAEYHDL